MAGEKVETVADSDEYPKYIPTCNGTELSVCVDSWDLKYGKEGSPDPLDDLDACMAEHLRICPHRHTVRVRFGQKFYINNYEYDYVPTPSSDA